MTSITVTGDVSTVVYAASRAELPMIIYDQSSPPLPSGFNSLMQQTTPVLISGDGFNTSAQAYFDHKGRKVAITTTRLNVNTLLVQVPNYLRLLPGTARITVVGLSLSNSLDMPIVYPVPHLDSVSPNLWAADPDLVTTPVVLFDGETSAGNDSYIARRDYYIYLRDHLWNASTVGGTNPANNSVVTWFPNFNFDALPGFPLVSFDGEPMPRFIESTPSGNLVIRLAESAYASPRVFDVYLQNPAPGGGMSNVLTLNAGAPLPVIASIDPPTLPPKADAADFTLIVRGPANVPQWPGYEEPKTGNFTASSIVRLNGANLATTFVTSSEPHAIVPGGTLAAYGNFNITVHTPSNNSVYFEELHTGTTRCVGGNNSGQPCTTGASCPGGECTDIMWQGDIPSGCTVIGVNPDGTAQLQCESAPILFHVGFPTPAITQLSFPELATCSLGVNGTPPYDLEVAGTGFATGAIVLVNGHRGTTLRESDTLLRAKLTPADVSNAATLQIKIGNPAPDGSTSPSVAIPVVSTDCNTNGTSDQSEILAGTIPD